MARLPKGSPTLRDVLRDQRRQLRKQGTASSFSRSGLQVTGEGVVDASAGTLLLAPGSVSNEDLANPVNGSYIYDYVTNFPVTVAPSFIRTTTITVPAGFTQAIVSVTARVYAINGTAGLDYLYCQANVSGSSGLAIPTQVAASGSGTNVSPFSSVLTGLTGGGTFSVQITASTAFASWPANASNAGDVAGSVIWLR